MTDPTLTTHSDTAPWTRLVRIDASGLAATRRCLGYLLRSLVRAVDKDRIGEHRLRNLPVELGNCLLPLALGASSTAQFFGDLCDRFDVDPMGVPGPDGLRPLAVFFPARREVIDWHRLLASPPMGLDAVRDALRSDGVDLFATFATARAADPDEDEHLWADLAAQPVALHHGSPAVLPDPGRAVAVPHHAAVLTLTSPLAHGADTKSGNVNQVRREPAVDPLTGRRSLVPFVAGNAFRGQLRDILALRYLALLGLAPEEIPPGVAHTLLAGGSIEAGADTLDVVPSARRAMRRLCPPLDLVAGSLPGQGPAAGCLAVADLTLVCRENAWLVHPTLGRPGESVADLAARLAPADTLVTTRQSTRHAHRELDGADGVQMLMQTEVIVRGAQFVHTVQWRTPFAPSPVTAACLADGLALMAAGGLTGARTSSAFGAFATDGWRPAAGAAPLPDPSVYLAHVAERRDAMRAWVLAGGREPAAVLDRGTSEGARAEAKRSRPKKGAAAAPPAPPPADQEGLF